MFLHELTLFSILSIDIAHATIVIQKGIHLVLSLTSTEPLVGHGRERIPMTWAQDLMTRPRNDVYRQLGNRRQKIFEPRSDAGERPVNIRGQSGSVIGFTATMTKRAPRRK